MERIDFRFFYCIFEVLLRASFVVVSHSAQPERTATEVGGGCIV